MEKPSVILRLTSISTLLKFQIMFSQTYKTTDILLYTRLYRTIFFFSPSMLLDIVSNPQLPSCLGSDGASFRSSLKTPLACVLLCG